MTVLPLNHLTYSTGPRGSRRLRRAAAAFLTEEFQSRETITADNIFITPGLASAIDALAWSICDEGEGILVPQPFYNGFIFDTLNRSNARVVGVTYEDVEGYSGLDCLFHPDVNKKAIEAAFRKAENDGITVRALLISKSAIPPAAKSLGYTDAKDVDLSPHNPLGRCYVRFCSPLLIFS